MIKRIEIFMKSTIVRIFLSKLKVIWSKVLLMQRMKIFVLESHVENDEVYHCVLNKKISENALNFNNFTERDIMKMGNNF